jgi:hypothetical protein
MIRLKAAAILAAAGLLSTASAQQSCSSVKMTSGAVDPTSSSRCQIPMSWAITGGTTTSAIAKTADIYFLVSKTRGQLPLVVSTSRHFPSKIFSIHPPLLKAASADDAKQFVCYAGG